MSCVFSVAVSLHLPRRVLGFERSKNYATLASVSTVKLVRIDFFMQKKNAIQLPACKTVNYHDDGVISTTVHSNQCVHQYVTHHQPRL